MIDSKKIIDKGSDIRLGELVLNAKNGNFEPELSTYRLSEKIVLVILHNL